MKNVAKGQSSAEDVWGYVLDDLKYCIENQHYPDNTLKNNYGRPSKGAAYALRGMVYMLGKKMYQEAANDFKKVKDCGYGLFDGEYAEIFKIENEKSKEMNFLLYSLMLSQIIVITSKDLLVRGIIMKVGLSSCLIRTLLIIIAMLTEASLNGRKLKDLKIGIS